MGVVADVVAVKMASVMDFGGRNCGLQRLVVVLAGLFCCVLLLIWMRLLLMRLWRFSFLIVSRRQSVLLHVKVVHLYPCVVCFLLCLSIA